MNHQTLNEQSAPPYVPPKNGDKKPLFSFFEREKSPSNVVPFLRDPEKLATREHEQEEADLIAKPCNEKVLAIIAKSAGGSAFKKWSDKANIKELRKSGVELTEEQLCEEAAFSAATKLTKLGMIPPKYGRGWHIDVSIAIEGYVAAWAALHPEDGSPCKYDPSKHNYAKATGTTKPTWLHETARNAILDYVWKEASPLNHRLHEKGARVATAVQIDHVAPGRSGADGDEDATAGDASGRTLALATYNPYDTEQALALAGVRVQAIDGTGMVQSRAWYPLEPADATGHSYIDPRLKPHNPDAPLPRPTCIAAQNSYGPSGAQAAALTEIMEIIEAAELPDDEATFFLEYHLDDDITHADMAAKYGINEKTVRRRLKATLAQLSAVARGTDEE
jgi:DNA-directed RNA polymerase specialized sigma24 family protein